MKTQKPKKVIKPNSKEEAVHIKNVEHIKSVYNRISQK